MENQNINEIRNQLIEEFKKHCPKGILEVFKNDDEIWEYIIENSEIKIEDSQISELIDDILEEENENK